MEKTIQLRVRLIDITDMMSYCAARLFYTKGRTQNDLYKHCLILFVEAIW